MEGLLDDLEPVESEMPLTRLVYRVPILQSAEGNELSKLYRTALNPQGFLPLFNDFILPRGSFNLKWAGLSLSFPLFYR